MDQPKYYEQWGAPVLLYRHHPSYLQQNETDVHFPNAAMIKPFLRDEARLHRAMARWYLPQEFPLCLLDDQREDHSSTLMKVFRCFEGAGGMKLFGVSIEPGNEDTANMDIDGDNHASESSSDEEDKNNASSGVVQKPKDKRRVERLKRTKSLHKKMLKRDFVEANIDPDMQINHAEMLLAGQLETDDDEALAKKKLLVMSQLDTNFIPTLKAKGAHNRTGFIPHQQRQNCMYSDERIIRGDPAYLAPFPVEFLRDLTKIERGDRTDNKYHIHSKLQTLRGPNPPKAFGNCLLSFPCQCGYCLEHAAIPTPCILHPVGPMLDRLRLGFCWLENNHDIEYCFYKPPRMQSKDPCFMHEPAKQVDFDFGEKVLEVRRCGANELLFVVRTACYLTLVRVEFWCQHPKSKDNKCWSSAYIVFLQRWDHRTLSRSILSFQPASVAAHPNFGKHSPANIVATYKASNGRQNYIHHIHATGTGQKVEQHVVRNLQEITHIEFSSGHPMVLWSAARSFVHPMPWTPKSVKGPRIGYGTALFSVDLRCSQEAKFQWSPSLEDYYPESILSISGLSTDWSSDHRLWVSSISASRTWELDSRMPCRAVTSFSLPHYADQQPAIQSRQEVMGSGSLFSHPWNASPRNQTDDWNAPVLCVGKSPRTFGIHLYHRLKMGHFHAVATECFDGPYASCMNDLNIARSAVFPLPDRSDTTFPIGLTSFQLGLDCVMGNEDAEETIGCPRENLLDMLCAISLTSKGDMYLHSLLGTTSPERLGEHHSGLPGGSSVVTVPEVLVRPGNPKGLSWNGLYFRSSNEMPIPGDAVDYFTAYERRNVVNLKKRSTDAQPGVDPVADPGADLLADSLANGYIHEGNSSEQYLTTENSKCKVRFTTKLRKSESEGQAVLGLQVVNPELRKPSDYLDERTAELEEIGEDAGDLERSDVNAALLKRAWPTDAPTWNHNEEDDEGESDADEAVSTGGSVGEESAGDDDGDGSGIYEDV